ncbi:MAG: DUF4159 domain-containing protein [Planctomycetota bacterium]|nr:MAG: DUF4159 domain-containing protein [Planctomycetota bacterium]
MTVSKSAPYSVYLSVLLPALIGVLALALLWPLFEAGTRLQRDERYLFGPIPTLEQRVERDFLIITEPDVAQAATSRLYDYFTHIIKEEHRRHPVQHPADETRSREELEAEQQQRIRADVDNRVRDFREIFALFLQRYDFELSTVKEDAFLDSEQEQENGGGRNIISHMGALLSNLSEAAEGQYGLAEALIQQLELAITPDEDADQYEDEMMMVLSPADQAFQAMRQEWSIGRVASYLILLGILACAAVIWSLLTLLKGQRSPRRLHRAYLAAYGISLVTMIAGLGIIPLITRAHFGEAGDGWAQALLSDLFAYGWPLLIIVGVLIIGHVHGLRARSLVVLGVESAGPAAGDRFLEHLRTGGKDPEYSSATRRSVLLHLLALIGPILLSLFPGCWGSDSYRMPAGSGQPVAAVMVQVVEEEQEKEELILAEDSPIIFERATIDDSDAMNQLVEQSKNTYEATGTGTPGNPGIGGEGPGGYLGAGGPIRFIRIRHRSQGWDDGMTAATGNADANFLRWLGRAINLETESRGEAMTIEQIYNRFPRGERPPFVYLTGRSLSLSNSERETLRKLCLEGTLLFADAETPRFHRDFTREMRRVFPDRQLIHINDEDPIMRIPHVFPNGLRSNQWHGPQRAFGIRHQRRLVVFYHPGDANDMWKDNAHLIPREIRDTAFWIGQNIVHYSFRRYYERYGGGRR